MKKKKWMMMAVMVLALILSIFLYTFSSRNF